MKTPVLTTLLSFGVYLCQGQPANDMFARAIVLIGTNVAASGSNLGATKEPGEPDHAGDPGGHSVWWTWTAPDDYAVLIRTAGSSFDTVLGVYTGSSVSGLTTIASNDEDPDASDNTSKVVFNASANQTYQIAVDGYDGTSGSIQLELVASPPPANDMFANALQLTGTNIVVTGSNVGATKEPGEPSHAGGTGAASIWWTWTAPASCGVTISTAGSSIDTVLAVYTGVSVPNLTLITSNDNGPDGDDFTSKASFNATRNRTYHIAVDGRWEEVAGSVQLQLAAAGPWHAETVAQSWAQYYRGSTNDYGEAVAVAVDHSDNVLVLCRAAYDYATLKYSSDGLPLWTNRYDFNGGLGEYPGALAVDSHDNVVVTGESYGGGTSRDYATVKYSSACVPLWTRRFSGDENSRNYDIAHAVAVDSNDDVIVTGQSDSEWNWQDYLTIKYSSTGVPLWTNRFTNGEVTDIPYAVAVDGSNNVIVTGASAAGWDVYIYLTLKYSSAGVPLWTNIFSVQSWDHPRVMLAVDHSNNVVVAGHAPGDSDWAGAYQTVKYSSAGVPLWTNRYAGEPAALAVDGDNNVIVSGMTPEPGGPPCHYFATVKYSSQGVPLWTNRYDADGQSTEIEGLALAVDRRKDVVLTGTTTEGSYGLSHQTTIKYSKDGMPLWTNVFSRPGEASHERGVDVAVDSRNHVLLLGEFSGQFSGNYILTTKLLCAPILPPPYLTGLPVANGSFQVQAEDLFDYGTLVLEASTNLVGWTPLFTNTTPTNVVLYTDPNAGSTPRRLYRAFQFP